MTREGIIKVCSEGTKQSKIENVFYFSLTSISFFSSRRTGKGCASVLNIQCSSGRRSSSENIKYKYLQREKNEMTRLKKPCHKATHVSVHLVQTHWQQSILTPTVLNMASFMLRVLVHENHTETFWVISLSNDQRQLHTKTVMSRHLNWDGDYTLQS